jgi:transporter family-2 protein
LRGCLNAQLYQSLGNKWPANAVSFAPIMAFFLGIFAMFPHLCLPPRVSPGCLGAPLWADSWEPFEVYRWPYSGPESGAGPLVDLTVTAALVMSLVLDHYGRFHMQTQAINC